MKKLKEMLQNWRKEREADGFIIDNDIINLTYWVMKNYSSHIEEEDICLIYDNLEINSEIISLDNLEEYEPATIEKITGHHFDYVKQQLEKGYFYLLDFYYVDSKGRCQHRDNVSLKFQSGYNAL